MTKIKMYCFPYSGGSAGIYHGWISEYGSLADIRALEYSGHGQRMDEPQYGDIAEAAEDMADRIAACGSEDIVLFGYSYGSMVAMETAFALRERGIPVLALIVAAERPPHLRWKDRQYSRGTRDEAMEEMIKLGNIPDELIECRELYDLFSEIIYSDLKLNDSWEHDMDLPPLDIPVYVFAGTEDDETPEDDMREFSFYTSGKCIVRCIEGGHFFAFDEGNGFHGELSVVLAGISRMAADH